MANTKLNILITRPEQKGRILADKLKSFGINSICQSFFDYQSFTNKQEIQSTLAQNNQPIIIFVSVAAVTYAQKNWPISLWPCKSVIAVGKATQHALEQLKIHPVICPEQHDSEGVLALSELTQVKQQDIIIVRGDGGREHIAQTLIQRGATVTYIESYQRVWRTFPNNIAKQWQVAEINCIVITSNALLERVVELINGLDSSQTLDNNDKNWKNNCLWIVASKRIAENAKLFGLNQIINAQGANEQAIIAAIVNAQTSNMELGYDRQ